MHFPGKIFFTLLFLFAHQHALASQAQVETKEARAYSKAYARITSIAEVCDQLPFDLVRIIASYEQYRRTCGKGIAVYALVALPNGKIAAGLANGEMHIIDPTADPLQKQADLKIIHAHDGPVTALKMLSTGQLFSGSTVDTCSIYLVQEGETTRPADHRILVCGRAMKEILPYWHKDDDRFKLWNPKTTELVEVLEPKDDLAIDCIERFANKRLRWDGTSICARLISLITKQQVKRDSTHCIPSTVPSYRMSNEKFQGYDIVGYKNGTLTKEQIGAETTLTIQRDGEAILVIKGIAPTLFATGSQNGTIKIWSLLTGVCIQTIDEHVEPVYALDAFTHSWKADGKKMSMLLLVSGVANGTMGVHPIEATLEVAPEGKN